MAPCPSTRRPHNLLKLCSEVAIRVPPAQSSTDDEQLASASSGSRARNARVTLVSRVPNRNTETRLRASVMACRKCRNSRVYSLIEPEISSSATIGAGLSIRPESADIDDLAAGAQGAAQRAAHVEPQAACVGLIAAGAQLGLRQASCCAMARVTSAISAALICAKSFFCSTLLVGDRQPQFLLLGLRRLLAHRRAAPAPPARGATPAAASSWRDPAAAPDPACASSPRRRGRTGRRPARRSAHARAA